MKKVTRVIKEHGRYFLEYINQDNTNDNICLTDITDDFLTSFSVDDQAELQEAIKWAAEDVIERG